MYGMESLLSMLCCAMWQGALFGGTAYLLAKALRQLGPEIEHALWVMTLLAMVFVPLVSVAHGNLTLTGVSRQAASGLPAMWWLVNGGQSAPSHRMHFPAWVFYGTTSIYLAIVTTRLIGILAACWRIKQICQRTNPVQFAGRQQEIWKACQNRVKQMPLELRVSKDICGPVVAGFVRQLILVPESFTANSTDAEFQAVIGHEVAHLQRRDPLKNLVYEVLAVTVIFHPVAWWLRRKIDESREKICDRMAIQQVMDGREYARCLLAIAEKLVAVPQMHKVNAIGIFDARNLEERVMRIRESRKSLGYSARRAIIASVAAVLVAIGLATAAHAVPVALQSTGAEEKGASPVPKGFKPAEMLHALEVHFPEAMKGKHGVVRVKMAIDTAGVPDKLIVEKSDEAGFNNAALDAVRVLRFKPAELEGKAVPSEMLIDISFQER